jgi:hypothetical protein
MMRSLREYSVELPDGTVRTVLASAPRWALVQLANEMNFAGRVKPPRRATRELPRWHVSPAGLPRPTWLFVVQ